MNSKNDSKFNQPLTSGKRLFKLAGTSATIAKHWVKSSATGLFLDSESKTLARKELYTEIGQELAQTFGQMKGAVMKVGQIMAQIKDFLPEEISQALGTLREQSVSMDYETVEAQIVKSFGEPPSALFKSFDRQPYKAASLGQVHRAQLKSGQDVVVKVQYPGVREACESDLRQLYRIIRLMSAIKIEKVKIEKARLDSIFEKINQMILGELDFEQEAANLKRFGAFHHAHDFVVMPNVIDSLSSVDVLTMTYEPGHSLIELQEPERQTPENQALRNRVAENLYRLFSEEIIHLNTAHMDPHAGNFAYRDDGAIVMYDFGAVADFDLEVIKSFKGLLETLFAEDHDELDRLLVARGLKRTSKPLGKAFYQEWIDIVKAPYSESLFNFGTSDLHLRSINKLKADWRLHMVHFAPMPDSLLLDRLIIGHYWNLVRLGAQINLKPLLERYVLNAEFDQ